MTIFAAAGDYETGDYEAGDREAFEQVLAEAVERTGTRLLAYTLMPNQWHHVVWPRKDARCDFGLGCTLDVAARVARPKNCFGR